MPCNCGNKGSSAPKTYTVRIPGQSPKAYRSEIEAKAEAARHPGATVRAGS